MKNTVFAICSTLIVTLVSSFGSPVRAETRAVLVGVSDYDDSIGLADLRGPENDIRLLQNILSNRGVSDMIVLADGVDGGIRPTRDAILSALGDMAVRAQDGDLVYIHLSGHGTRQIDPEGDETDGLDEVFLPADTARAEPGSNRIPNALVDDELGRAVTAIRATGADVWLVQDSCHSGSGLRAASTRTATRFVDPATLGVKAAPSRQDEPAQAETTGPAPKGGLLAFYAARSTELAREVDFAPDGGDPEWYGLFTAKLASRLQQAGPISYRQLFQAVLSDMNDAALPGGARLQTPLWEGTLIDAPVFGGSGGVGVRRFAVAGDELKAGLVHGLADGTLVGLVADAADDADAILGYAQTEDSAATNAYLRPVSADCVPSQAAPCPRAGRLPEGARFAQVVARPIDLIVRIAPPRAQTGDVPPNVLAALQQAIATVNEQAATKVALDADTFDIETLWDGQDLWFGPSAEIGGQPVGLNVAPSADRLAQALTRIGRAETLARLLGSVSGGGSLLNPAPVQITAEVAQVQADALSAPSAGVDPRRECRAAFRSVQGPEGLPRTTDLKQCDTVTFSAKGTVSGARDVNRVHIDAKFCVSNAYEHIEDSRAARRLGQDMTLCSDCPNGYSAGVERLFVIITEAADNAEPLNLSGLIDTCGELGTSTRSAQTRSALDLLTGLSARPNTRGSFGSFGVDNIWVERFDWRVLPKPEAFIRAGLPPDGN